MSTFKNCFISERPDFKYDILDPDGELIARAHLLTAGDRGYIQKHGTTRKFVNNEMEMELDLEKLLTATILKALDWWVWDRVICMESVEDLSKELRQYLSEQIQNRENEVTELAEDAEKN